MKKPAALILFALTLAACGQSAATHAGHAYTAQTAALYTDCLFTGNSVSNGADLPTSTPMSFIGYMINDLHGERTTSDCASSAHWFSYYGNGWCVTTALTAMQNAGYHQNVELATVQFGEDEWARASGCTDTPTQFQAHLATLLALIVQYSPTLTLVCTHLWDIPGAVGQNGYTTEAYNAAVDAACAASGAQTVLTENLTVLYPVNDYHTIGMQNGDTYHPDVMAHAAIGQEITDKLP